MYPISWKKSNFPLKWINICYEAFDWWTARALSFLNTWRIKLEKFYIQSIHYKFIYLSYTSVLTRIKFLKCNKFSIYDHYDVPLLFWIVALSFIARIVLMLRFFYSLCVRVVLGVGYFVQIFAKITRKGRKGSFLCRHYIKVTAIRSSLVFFHYDAFYAALNAIVKTIVRPFS